MLYGSRQSAVVIDAVGIRICAVGGNRESLYACLCNMLDELAQFTSSGRNIFTFQNIEVQITTTEQTEGQCQVLGCFHPPAGSGANDILVNDKVS